MYERAAAGRSSVLDEDDDRAGQPGRVS